MLVRTASADRVRVLNEAVFGTALTRERKRADRFNQQMAVVLISVAPSDCGRTVEWVRVINALAKVTRPSDMLGWVRRSTTLGVLIADIGGSDPAVSKELCRRFRAQLAKEPGADDSTRVSIGLDVSGLDDAGFTRAPTAAKALYPAIKRAFDLLGSASGLLILAPILLTVAAVVKLTSKGPVLFRQPRVGHREQTFRMLKFRTMRVDADPELHQRYVTLFINGSDRAATTSAAAPFKIAHDPRVTRVGAVLRKTSLDELPQLWNVLRGEMSIVGPRPPLDYEVQQYAAWHRRRVMDVKPGMTGLWQVTGRSCTTFDQMVRLDLRYAKTCSVATDLKILLATPAAVISGRGAR